MKKFIAAFLGLSLVIACNNQPAETQEESVSIDELRAEVMELHDKVMPEMTPMSKLQGQLMTASVGSEDSIAIMTVATDLKYAKEAMMVWMREFSNSFDESWSEGEKAEFFKAEKEKMQRIDQKTQEALKAGREMVSKLEAESTASADSSAAE